MSSRTSHRLKPVLFSFIGIMALLQVMVAVIATFSLQRVQDNDEKEHAIIHTLKHNMVDARFHIVQVQQFLTDASATGERAPLQEAAAQVTGERGEQLKKLLPVLWMKAGAIGAPPKATEEHRFYLFPRNRFAVLINPKYTYEFTKALREGGFDVAFIITDYESEYRSITDSLNVKQTYQLYRDYLENFAINTGRN